MNYKEQIEQAKHSTEKWREKHPIVGVGELRVDCMVDDLCRSITELLARAEAAEARAEKAEEIASDLCDDFTDFVTGGVPNAAPYCSNCRPECVDGRGWCNVENRVCKGFLPKAAGVKEE